MTKQKIKTIKERYQELKTLGDGEEFVKSFSTDELIKFRDALQIVDDNFSLTMKDSYTLGVIKSVIDARAKGYKI